MRREIKKFLSILSIFCLTSCMKISPTSCSSLNSVTNNSSNSQSVVFNKANRVKDANTMVKEGLFRGDLTESYYDDDNLYYTYYLGRVYDFIIHIYEQVEYSDTMKAYGNQTVQITEATENQVIDTYQKITTKVSSKKTSFNGGITINSDRFSAGTTGGLLGVMTNSVGVYYGDKKTTISANISKEWNDTVTETSEDIYQTITKESNEIVTSWTYDYSQMQPGVHYCFCTTANVDFFGTIIIDRKNGNYNIDYSSSIVSNIEKKVLTSDQNDFMDTNGVLTLNLSNIKELPEPTEYIDNHPLQSFDFDFPDVKVICGFPDVKKISDYDDGYNNCFPDIIKELYSYGYNSVLIDVSFSIMNGTSQVYINNQNSTNKNTYLASSTQETAGDTKVQYQYSFETLPITNFVTVTSTNPKDIYIIFDSIGSWPADVYYYNRKVTVSFDYIDPNDVVDDSQN